MDKRKIIGIVVACLAVMAMILASCAPTTTPTSTPTTPPTTTAPPTTPPKTTPPSPSTPQYGGTAVILTQYSYLDPAAGGWEMNGAYQPDIYTSWMNESLMWGDFEKYGPRGTNEWLFTFWNTPPQFMSGGLAQSWELTDSKTLVYHLRQGVHWQNKPPVNGREFVANDVVATWQHGIKAPQVSAIVWSWIDSVTAPDKYTVVFKMKDFYAAWDYDTGFGLFHLIYAPEVFAAGANDWKNQVGTGPYIISDYVPQSSVTYVRNPDYYRKDTIGGKEYQLPFLDRVIIPIVPDLSTRVAALRTGKVDILNNVPWQQVDSLSKSNPELKTLKFPTFTSTTINVRIDTTQFSDLRVRQAVWKAVDQDAIIKSFYGGEATKLNEPIMPGYPSYTPYDKLPAEIKDLFVYDPAKAKQLMKDAGYPNGFDLEIICDSTTADIVQLIAGYWQQIGINLKPTLVDTSQIATIKGAPNGVRGFKQAIAINHSCTSPFHGLSDYTWEDRDDATNWNDPTFEQLFFKAASDPVESERIDLWRQANLRILQQAVRLIPPAPNNYNYWQPWVKNYYGEMFVGGFHEGSVYSVIWLDQAARKAATGR